MPYSLRKSTLRSKASDSNQIGGINPIAIYSGLCGELLLLVDFWLVPDEGCYDLPTKSTGTVFWFSATITDHIFRLEWPKARTRKRISSLITRSHIDCF